MEPRRLAKEEMCGKGEITHENQTKPRFQLRTLMHRKQSFEKQTEQKQKEKDPPKGGFI